jgi:hypothetical protein
MDRSNVDLCAEGLGAFDMRFWPPECLIAQIVEETRRQLFEEPSPFIRTRDAIWAQAQKHNC